MAPPECRPGQLAYTFLIRILSTSLTSVSIFSVCCYSSVSISMMWTEPVFVNLLRNPGWYGNPICRTGPPREIDSSKSIHGLLKRLQIRALVNVQELGDQMHGLKRPILLRAYPNICNFFDKYIYQGLRQDKTTTFQYVTV
jgi:hypothetical protein